MTAHPRRVVWKFELRPGAKLIDLPRGAQLLHVGAQGSKAYVWALCDPDAPKVSRGVAVYPTGVGLPPVLHGADYVGTLSLNEQGHSLVFHVFDGGEQ